MTSLSREEKVANGVKWLDENHEGWRDKINIDILYLGCFNRCILGQLFGRYEGCRILFDDGEKADSRGFYIHTKTADLFDWDIDEEEEEYEKLTECWKKVL